MTVETFILSLSPSQAEIVNVIRELITRSSPSLVEGIKWNAPSYALDGNDIITFNFRNYGYVTLIFHTGPKGKDTQSGNRLFTDDFDLLEWAADKRAVLKIQNTHELSANADKIEKIVSTWVDFAKNSFVGTE